jgi:hypothetical protein
MSDELKDKFRNLVAEPPPPTAVPSEAVFAKVKTVRRRRAAGVTVVAAAAVAAIAVAGTNLTNVNSSPPVTSTPGAPTTIVTGPPTITPATPTPTTAAPTNRGTTGSTTTGLPKGSTTTGNTTTGPPKGSTSTTGSTTGTTNRPPALPPIGTSVTLKPKIDGRSLTMMVTLKGTVLVPRSAEDGKYLPTDSFMNLSTGTNYTFGDGEQSGSDGGSITCVGSKKRFTGQETYNPTFYPYVYKKPGTYTFTYTQSYCGGKGSVTKSIKIVIR